MYYFVEKERGKEKRKTEKRREGKADETELKGNKYFGLK